MYPQSLYNSFVQLRKQYYKAKRRVTIDRYDEIEANRAKFITFQRFYDEVQEMLSYKQSDNYESTQDIFTEMLERSQSRELRFYIY